MSAESAREFVDANVLVYAFDASAGHKKEEAERLLTRVWEADSGC
jgi:predicted nucleic acid-binding protein